MPLPNLGALTVCNARDFPYRAPRPTGPHFPALDADRDTSNIFAQIVAQVAEGDAARACATATMLIEMLSNATRTGLERVPRDPAADPSTPLEHNEALWSELVAAVFGQYGESMDVINQFYQPRPQPDRPPSRIVFETLCLEARRYSGHGWLHDNPVDAFATVLPEHFKIGAFVLAMMRNMSFSEHEQVLVRLTRLDSKLLKDYAFAEAAMGKFFEHAARTAAGARRVASYMRQYFPDAFVFHPPVRRRLVKRHGLEWTDLVQAPLPDYPHLFASRLTPLGQEARKDKDFMLDLIKQRGCAAFLLLVDPTTEPFSAEANKSWEIVDNAVIDQVWTDELNRDYATAGPEWVYKWKQIGAYRLGVALSQTEHPAMTDEGYVRDLLLICGGVSAYPTFVPAAMARLATFWYDVLNEFKRRDWRFYGTAQEKKDTFKQYAIVLTRPNGLRATKGLTRNADFWNNVFDMLPSERWLLATNLRAGAANPVFNSRRFMRTMDVFEMQGALNLGIIIQDSPVLRDWTRRNLLAGLDLRRLGGMRIAGYPGVVLAFLDYLYDEFPTSSEDRLKLIRAFLAPQPLELQKAVRVQVAQRDKYALPDVARSESGEWRPGRRRDAKKRVVVDSDDSEASD